MPSEVGNRLLVQRLAAMHAAIHRLAPLLKRKHEHPTAQAVPSVCEQLRTPCRGISSVLGPAPKSRAQQAVGKAQHGTPLHPLGTSCA